MDSERAKQERERLDHLPCPERDNREITPCGVLLSDEIEYYVNAFEMILPFNREQLKAAGYELSIGDEYVLGGEKKQLKKDDEIRIPPFNVVVIKTAETINLPRFLIARWNIRVRWAYEGLLWVGAPQVDPGWVGHLFCPLYNLSDKEVVLRFGEPIALMDFVTTTRFNPSQSKKYKRPPSRVLLQDYRAAELKSALYTLAETKIEAFKARLGEIKQTVEGSISGIRERVDNFILITFTVIAVLFAAVTIFVARTEQPSWWNPVLFLISGIAIFISAAAWVKTRQEQKFFGRATQAIIILFFLAATLLQLRAVSPLQSQIDDLKKQVDHVRQQIESLSSTPHPSLQQATPAPTSSAAPRQPSEKK